MAPPLVEPIYTTCIIYIRRSNFSPERPWSEGTSSSEEEMKFKAARSITEQKCLHLPDKMMTETSRFWSSEDKACGNSLKMESDSASFYSLQLQAVGVVDGGGMKMKMVVV
nr:hypothetical protein [Tanacetum cinerariifolium]